MSGQTTNCEVKNPDKGTNKGARLFGVDFAPLVVPIHRRLETMAAFSWIGSFLYLQFIWMAFLIYCLFTTWLVWIPPLYLAWMVYDIKTPYRGGRQNAALKRFFRGSKLSTYFRDFFPVQLIKTADLDPEKNYLFGSHPHGILCAGAFAAFATEACGFSKLFPGIEPHLLVLQGQFWFPGFRELALAMGICSASKDSMEHLMRSKKGTAPVLVVGGTLEAIEDHEDKIVLVLNRRKGFIKLALRFGVDLVPTFTFGEAALYSQIRINLTWFRKIQSWSERMIGFSPAFFSGRGLFQYSFGVVPRRHPLTVVVGTPIKVNKVEQPTNQQILELHSRYVDAVKAIYDEHNPKYGDKNIKLEIA